MTHRVQALARQVVSASSVSEPSYARGVSMGSLYDLAVREREDEKSRGALSDSEKLALVGRFARAGASTSLFMRWIDLRHVWLGGGYSVAQIIDDAVAYNPNGIALVDAVNGREFSFLQVQQISDRVARWAHDVIGLRRGDRASLFMENCPEFFFAWLGFAKVGVVTAFSNFKLHGRQLQHVLKIAEARVHLVTPGLAKKFAEVVASESGGLVPKDHVHIFGQGEDGTTYSHLEPALAKVSGERGPHEWLAGQTLDDTLWLIYTSGTTGMPKASTVTQRNILARISMLSHILGMNEKDRLYCALPLYHSTGTLLCLASLRRGGGVVISRQFSPRNFWLECDRFGATGIVYVGEVCRYLLQHYNTMAATGKEIPSVMRNGSRKVRFAVGNGMRPDVWTKFLEAYSITDVLELYGSTEGSGLVNISGRVGAVGYYPFPISRIVLSNNVLVRYDVEADDLIRDKNGFVIKCAPNEPGELLSCIQEGTMAAASSGGTFSGYTDKAATEKKILRNAFQKGDTWFRTGDLLRQDEFGFLFFVDRIGDTFRWKGENVSTAEVAEVFGTFPNIRECCVYGVLAPPNEGRAGMAAVAFGEPIPEDDDRSHAPPGPRRSLQEEAASADWAGLYAHCAANLATFARPIFLRVVEEVPKTATFKFKRNDLQTEGFDPTKCGESLIFIRDDKAKTYVPLTPALYAAVVSGTHAL